MPVAARVSFGSGSHARGPICEMGGFRGRTLGPLMAVVVGRRVHGLLALRRVLGHFRDGRTAWQTRSKMDEAEEGCRERWKMGEGSRVSAKREGWWWWWGTREWPLRGR